MNVTTQQLKKVIQKLELETLQASHHFSGFLVVDGVRVLTVVVPLGQKVLRPAIAHSFRKSLHLTVPEFERLFRCEMPRTEYLQILRSKGILPPSGVKTSESGLGHKGDVFNPTCFLSYSAIDEEFADKLFRDLQDSGIDCWFAPHALAIGDDIKDTIHDAIHERKNVVLVLSRSAIDSEWVAVEVRKALEEEKARGANILFPIRIDDAVFDPGEGWYRSIRRRLIGDFRSWNDPDRYATALERLLRDLRK